MDLAELAHRCRRDPEAYAEEFGRQRKHLEAQLGVFQLQPEALLSSGGVSSGGGSAVMGGKERSAAAARKAPLSGERAPGGSQSGSKLSQREARAQTEAVAQAGEARADRAAVKNLRDLVMFVCNCSDVYRAECSGVGPLLIGLLDKSGAAMAREVRQSLVSALMVLRAKGVVSALDVLPVFFRLLRCADKPLRASLRGHIVADVRTCNAKKRDNRLNNALQGFLFSVVSANDSELGSKMAVDILIDLYHRNVWHDTKTVNAISKGVFSRSSKVVTATLRFFLGEKIGGRGGGDSDSSEDEQSVALMTQRARLLSNANHTLHNGSKNTVGKKRRRAKAVAKADKLLKQAENAGDPDNKVNWPALELLHDPQAYTEKAFSTLRGSNERFEVRLMLMNLISRLIGLHKLEVPNFYAFMQRYLRPRQERVTYILVALAQGVHEHVLPETLEPVVRTLADNFVADRCEPEAVAAGLNTIREILTRNPLVIPDDDPMGIVRDLTGYVRHRDRNVVQAARALVNLFRTINPNLLKRKDRGKSGAGAARDGLRPLQFGEQVVPANIEGIELLELLDEYKATHGEMDDAEAWTALTGQVEGDSAGDSDDDSSSGGWVEMSSDGEGAGAAVGDADIVLDSSDDGSDSDDDAASSAEEEGGVGEPHLDQERVLTALDLDRLKKLKKMRSEGLLDGTAGKPGSRKRGAHHLATQQAAPGLSGVVIDQGDIEGVRKRAKMSYEERMAHMAEGREDGVKFSHAAQKLADKGGGSSNVAKKKTKAFSMIRHKREVREKLTRGTNERLYARKKANSKGNNSQSRNRRR